jgi:hypothetical protein
MIDPTKIDINQLPKKFIDGAIGAFAKEVFYVSLSSGNTLDSFASTPQTMKSIAIWMNKQIENYEKSFGEIDMNPPKVVSPIQVSDLDKPKRGIN